MRKAPDVLPEFRAPLELCVPAVPDVLEEPWALAAADRSRPPRRERARRGRRLPVARVPGSPGWAPVR
ncbi:hypothetical protein, partial [Nocardia neocaledoniensis]|uniref:hypothetical protein n=1 Tax=Nocardia neocaledoniensis TaxID=236511 RepID=UPI001C9954B8